MSAGFTSQIPNATRGRGARSNATGRYESQARETFDDAFADARGAAADDHSLAREAGIDRRTRQWMQCPLRHAFNPLCRLS